MMNSVMKLKKTRFSIFWTVAIAFFLAEMGDKTQLATVALSAQIGADMLSILVGTTLGMLVADGFGILLGATLHKYVPDRVIKKFCFINLYSLWCCWHFTCYEYHKFILT